MNNIALQIKRQQYVVELYRTLVKRFGMGMLEVNVDILNIAGYKTEGYVIIGEESDIFEFYGIRNAVFDRVIYDDY